MFKVLKYSKFIFFLAFYGLIYGKKSRENSSLHLLCLFFWVSLEICLSASCSGCRLTRWNIHVINLANTQKELVVFNSLQLLSRFHFPFYFYSKSSSCLFSFLFLQRCQMVLLGWQTDVIRAKHLPTKMQFCNLLFPNIYIYVLSFQGWLAGIGPWECLATLSPSPRPSRLPPLAKWRPRCYLLLFGVHFSQREISQLCVWKTRK